MTFSKGSILFVFSQVVSFTAICLWFAWAGRGVPDALIVAFFAWFGLEGGALALLKVNERKQKTAAALQKENAELKKQLARVRKAAGVPGQEKMGGA